jgi:peptidoglycan/xylan/chitin deacetylase (PgdA/CDA1 family)
MLGPHAHQAVPGWSPDRPHGLVRSVAERDWWHSQDVRRREFLATALAAVTLAGCSSARSAQASSASASASAASVAATPMAGLTSPTPPVATRGTPGAPGEVLQRSTVPVLCYHQIREHTTADSAGARSLICPPAVLERHLRALVEAGMQPVTSTALVDHLELGAPLPARPVMISFDDASAGHFTAALPILQRLRMPATFFVMTVVLDKPNWLRRDQVRLLDRADMTIGVHTWDHHRVTSYTEPDWAAQLERPKAELEGIVGHRLDLFAYPYGAWNSAALPHVQQAGYRASSSLTSPRTRSGRSSRSAGS